MPARPHLIRQNGSAIRELRKAKGLTLDGLAFVADLSTPNLSGIEKEIRGCLPETLAKIAEALEEPLDAIMRPGIPTGLVTADHIDRYKNGTTSIRSLATELGRSQGYVRKRLREAGALIRGTGPGGQYQVVERPQ